MEGAILNIATFRRMFIARRLADQVANASTALQSTGTFMQFVAPCLGALLTRYVSTNTVFLVLGTLSALCLAAVTLRFGKEGHAVTASTAAVPD